MRQKRKDGRARWASCALALAVLAPALAGQDSESWGLLAPQNNPGERADYMAAFCAASGKTILYGGQSPVVIYPIEPPFADTWAWNGTDWEELILQDYPPARTRGAMALDPIRERIVLFGGISITQSGALLRADTWEFDGAEWTEVQAVNPPPPLVGAAMTWDPINEKLLLFGGGTAFAEELVAESYHYDGTTWELLAPANSPTHRKDHRMVTDTLRDRIVLFGGTDQERRFLTQLTTRSNETWEWDGANWTLRNPLVVPGRRRSFGMAFDSVLGRTIVAYGISGNRWLGDTWAWDGSTWTSIIPFGDPKPSARGAVQLVENPNAGRMMMFGGDVIQPLPGQLLETWELSSPEVAGFSSFGSGCSGSEAVPSLKGVAGSRPVLDQDWQLRLTDLPLSPATLAIGVLGFSKDHWGALPLPIALDPLGAPGCSLLVSFNRSSESLPINAAGTADLVVAIPSSSALVGLEIYLQGFVVDSGANPLGVSASGAIEARIGSL
ncbi:MAG: Kelch repeat-containing protein [Planctomycetota bacterium]